MTTGTGLAIIGAWLPLAAAFIGSSVNSKGVWAAIWIGAILTGLILTVGANH